MPQSSYLQNNSYSELDFKPYNLDYSSILKEASAKTSYWMEGAAKIQQAYSKITGLAPQFIKNKEALNEFNSQVKDKIKKLAGTDLSIQGNANMINDVIAPLYDTSNPTSEAILLDDSYNKAGQNLLKTIENYKTKDKGAAYSPNNEKYATEWYQEYMKKAQDPNASLNDLRSLRSQVKQYTPYYDYTKELEFAITKCPENKGSTETANQGYIQDVSVTSKNVTGCIQAFLSDKAKSQMQIDGYVEYGKNYTVLGNEYKKQALEVNTFSQKDIGKLKAQQLEKGITPEVYKALQKEIDAKAKEIQYNNNIVNKIDLGDYSDIEKNYESFAGSIYTRNKIKSFSAYNKNPEDNTVTTLNDDINYLTRLKIQNDNYQNSLDRQLTSEKVSYGQGTPGVLGQGEEFYVETALDKTANKVQTENTFIEEGKAILSNKISTIEGIITLINNTYGSTLSKPLTIAEYPEFMRNLSPTMRAEIFNDSDMKSYVHQLNQIVLAESLHNSQQKSTENKIKQEINKINKPVVIKTASGNFTTDTKNIHKFIFSKSEAVRTIDQDGYPIITEEVVWYTNANHGIKERVLNSESLKEYDKSFDIRSKHYSKAKTYTTMKMTTNALSDNESVPLKKSIFNQIKGMYNSTETGEDGTPLVKDIKDIGTGKTDGKSTIEVIIPTKNKETADRVTKELGSTDRTAIYLGNGKYELKYNDPTKFPEYLRINNTSFFTEGVSIMINDIQEDNFYKINDKVVLLDNFNGYEVFINKGNPLIWYKKIGSSAAPDKVSNVSKLQEAINPQ